MHCMAALKVEIEMPYLVISHLPPPPPPPHLSLSVLQASEEGSLQALESVMTEFFHSCTTNDRKREIGEHMTLAFTQLFCRVILCAVLI